MSVSLVKGDKISLTKDSPLKSIRLGLGWKTKSDLDSIVFLTNSAGVIEDTIFYGNRYTAGITHNGDDLVGGKVGDCETISINLDKLPNWCTKLQLCINIFSLSSLIFQFSPFKTFAFVKDAYVRLINRENNEELCKYNLTKSGKLYDAFHFADLYKDDDGIWYFKAIGEPMRGNVEYLRRQLSR